MKVTTLDEKSIRDIGHAFGYYDYEEETGMSAAFSGKEATANYICAYVRGVLRGGFLHTTSEMHRLCGKRMASRWSNTILTGQSLQKWTTARSSSR